MNDKKSYFKILLKTIIIFVGIYIFSKALEVISSISGFDVFLQISKFLDLNLFTIIIIVIIASIGQITAKLKSPFNLGTPILKAIPIVYVIKLITTLLVVIAISVSTDLSVLLRLIDFLNPFIFWGIIILGYYKILTKTKKDEKLKEELKNEIKEELKEEEINKQNQKEKMKKEIKDEIINEDKE